MAKTITWTAPYGAPAATPSLQAGGSLAVGTTYYYRVVAVKHGGVPWNTNQVESPASVEVSATPTAGNQTIRLTWPQVAGANYYWVHRTTTSGSYLGSKKLGSPVADGGAGGTTYDDDGSDSLGSTQATFAAPDLPLGFDPAKGRGSLTITGGSSGDPITFDDIYTAIGDDDFCKYMDDSIFGLLGYWYQNNEATETHFKDTLKTVYTLGGTRLDFTHVDSEIIFGAYDSGDDYSYDGCIFYHCGPYMNGLEFAAGCKMYGCTLASYYSNSDFRHQYCIYGERLALGDFEEMKECKVDGFNAPLINGGANQGAIEGTILRINYLYPVTTDPTNADDLTIKGGYVYTYYNNLTRLSNFKVYPSGNYDVYIYSGFSSPDDKNVTFVNPYFHNRTDNIPIIHWQNFVDDGYGFVDIFYEFDITILDKNGNAISGATVKVEDKDGTALVDTTTDANGQISTQEIKAARYTHKAGSGSGSGPSYTDTDDRGQFMIKISKAGYGTFSQYFTMTAAIDWTFALIRSPYGGKDAMGAEWR